MRAPGPLPVPKDYKLQSTRCKPSVAGLSIPLLLLMRTPGTPSCVRARSPQPLYSFYLSMQWYASLAYWRKKSTDPRFRPLPSPCQMQGEPAAKIKMDVYCSSVPGHISYFQLMLLSPWSQTKATNLYVAIMNTNTWFNCQSHEEIKRKTCDYKRIVWHD